MKDKLKIKTPFKMCLIFLLIVSAIFVIARYVTDEDFRISVDTYVFKKDVSNMDLKSIELNQETSATVFSYQNKIAVLSKNVLTQYSSDLKNSTELDLIISVPIIECTGDYLLIAENDGKQIYLIKDDTILWNQSVDGSILVANVNKNGYVSVIYQSSSKKMVVAIYNSSGVELFKTYISSNYPVCSCISNNNEYLAIGEVDYSKTNITSYVKIISISLAQYDSEKSFINTYEADSGEIITNISFSTENDAICMFNSYVQKVTATGNERVYEITDNDLFLDISLNDNLVIVSKQSSGLFSYEYELRIVNIENKTESIYILSKSIPKEIIIGSDSIALNFGDEIQVVNSNGWLVKKCKSSKEIKNIIIGKNVAGIVYKNKVEIIDF